MKLRLAARTHAIVLLALVATSGAVAGVVGDRLLSGRQVMPPADPARDGAGAAADAQDMGDVPWRYEARPMPRYGERIARTLDLSAEQRTAIDSIVAQEQARVRALTAEVQPRFRAIATDTRVRIEEVLTAQQRDRLDELRSERMRGMRPEMRGLMRQRRDSMMQEGAAPRRPMMERRRELRDSVARSRSQE
jgi:hypothetical protein